MRASTVKGSSWAVLLAGIGALTLTACSGAPGRLDARGVLEAPDRAASTLPAPRVRSVPLYGNGSSIAGAGSAGWTTPPAGGSVQPAPVPITSTWSPPPAPAAAVVAATPAPTAAPCAPPAAPIAAPAQRSWSGCKLPCADGISMWHVRGVIGEAYYFGDDSGDNCLYWGADVGRTFCGCWGMDLFYRYHSGQFDRSNPGDPSKDGGGWHHVGAKFTFEGQFGSSRFYWWAGAGPEYFWTEKYISDDSGFGVFGEVGVGYLINQNLRVRLGLNAHGMDTEVTRKFAADDGESRWLWVLAPVAELEFSF